MPLEPGQKIASYEVIAPLGAGGMGEVWRARDTRLGREVAIKALPEAFVRDAERLARFEREARTLASLNHANVAAIYGLEDAHGAPHLVLELVEGESLAQRLARGPLSVRETLETGAQIAAAVQAAHERGIVHRDLKPANVMLTASDAVKVLDFGLAKDTGAGDDAAETVAAPPTVEGKVLGTIAYMSPEQARGLAVDRRTDVWAFGCILFECLTGLPAFSGPTSSDVLSRVLEREPDWNLLGPGVPQRLREVLRRCLVKEADARPRDIGDVRIELLAIERDLSSGSRPAMSTGPSLAVLYFDNLAKDPESEYFCGGITEDILTDLSKVSGLRVTSKNAVARYRGKDVDLAHVGAELAVTAVLEGSVRRAGDRVRINAQLVNAADGFQLWAERYDRTLEDVFAVQEEIASAIAKAMQVALTPQDVRRMGHDKPNDVRAYDLYLKGRERYTRYTAESLKEALALFEEAIALDPDYALAWAGKADVLGQEMQFRRGDMKRNRDEGLAAAERAIALDPNLPEAYKAKALVLDKSGDPDGSRRELERGLEVDPRNVLILMNLGIDRYHRGDLAGAERCLRRAIEVDPHQSFALLWLAGILTDTVRYDEAMAVVRRVRRLTDVPFYVTGATMLRMNLHLARGEVDRADAAVSEGKRAGAEPHSIRAMEAIVAAAKGDVQAARAALPSITQEATGFMVSLWVADLAARLGEIETASEIMQWPINRGPGVEIRLIPGLRVLADLPEFGPRRADMTLIWPVEAPMIDVARFRLFREVKLESGIPDREGPV